MSNFTIEFAYPWLLLLLIPALALAFFLHFRLDKRHRRTRNRIISLVLHVAVVVLSVTVLSGMTFSYDTTNIANEILIVADYSYSGEEKKTDKDNFIRSIIEESNDDYTIGVVTFGYNQVYAAPLDNDSDKVYENFRRAERPDGSATDIASAIAFARSKITNPSTAQIVVISDGVETDGNALGAIRSVAAEGIRVSSMYYSNPDISFEAQIDGIVLPSINPSINETFRIGVTVRSSIEGNATLSIADNGKTPEYVDIKLESGVREYYVDCKFATGGMHVMKFGISFENDGSDSVEFNNEYISYINVENFNKLLIIERASGESKALENILETNEIYDVLVVGINSADLPKTVNALRVYDQIVLNNISNADLQTVPGLIENIETYVRVYGGGLFTVGGNKTDDEGRSVANTYVESDMLGTLYQQMLPVQAIEFTPPVAVMIVIDKSGSMTSSSSSTGNTKLEDAKDGAKAAVRALTSRDYCGIMTLTNDFTVEQTLIPASQRDALFSVIDSIEANGGTIYSPAIERAGRLLSNERRVERRHIVLVSDGLPSSDDNYSEAIERNYKNYGVTLSMMAIGLDANANVTALKYATEEVGHGRFYSVTDTEKLVDVMREELNVDEIKAVNYGKFEPEIHNPTSSVVNGIRQLDMPSLYGFYGTRVKDSEGIDVPLNGEYVPIYAQWTYGTGKVGSFMCDLNGGDWSGAFMQDEVGQKILRNIVNALMPTQNIHPQDIDVGFEEDNYTTSISIYTALDAGENIKVDVYELAADGSVGNIIDAPQTVDGYSRLRVAITQPGVYKIVVNKLDASGNSAGTYETYRAFSYSKEYDMFYDAEAAAQLMTDIAVAGGGSVLEGAWELFGDPVTAIHHVVDPRIVLIIIAIALFLLDIAVRKFKFKWIHEIIRDRKSLREENGTK